jgi:uroporphyrinogen decarboxylase
VDIASSPFLQACRREAVDHVPVWFMRQAGRSLPEYRAIRTNESILEAVKNPELAAEVSLQPVRRYGVDAAILFSDIVVPVAAIGVDIEIVAGRGPVVAEPFRSARDLQRLRPLEPEIDTPYVIETIKILKQELDVPLIGFAGAPFTVASYLIEGGPSRNFTNTKALMYTDESTWFALMNCLADIALASLHSQVAAGADAIQLFDSWAGSLSRRDYEYFVKPSTTRVLEGIGTTGCSRIHFGVGTGELLDLMAGAGADVIGVDWRTSLTDASQRIGHGYAIQGNLDPAVCVAGIEPAKREAQRILSEGTSHGGHIFNLGHGVLPETDPDVLTQLVEFIHNWDPKDTP